MSLAPHGIVTDDGLLHLPHLAGRSRNPAVERGGRAERPPDVALLSAPPPLRVALCGGRLPRGGAGPPPFGGAEHHGLVRRHRHRDGARHLGFHAGARLQARPDGRRQTDGRRVRDGPRGRPDRAGGLRRRIVHPEPADDRLRHLADPAVAGEERPDRGRHGHRKRTGDGHQPPARERRQVEGDHSADRRREQPRTDRSAHGGRNRPRAGDPGLHHRGGLARRGSLSGARHVR